jgi:hypothetical protein
MFSLVSLKAKLITAGIILAVIVFTGLYINHLRDENKQLHKDITIQAETIKSHEARIEEDERRGKVLENITNEFDHIRNSNRKDKISKDQKIDREVNSGNDKPVGNILKDFLNGQ